MKISFKQKLINEAIQKRSIETESMIILTKIIDMVDDGHIDYTDKLISINVGKLIHNKKYNNLNLIIIKSDKNEVSIGRHKSDDKHSIFIKTDDFPARTDIDQFLSKKEKAHTFKEAFIKFINDANLNMDGEDSKSEKIKSLNTRENFESLYNNIINKLNQVFSQYKQAMKSIEDKIKNTSEHMGDKELLKLSADKLKKDMLGSSVEEFKRKALDIIGQENYKLLNKEFKEKLDSRLESFYDSKIK